MQNKGDWLVLIDDFICVWTSLELESLRKSLAFGKRLLLRECQIDITTWKWLCTNNLEWVIFEGCTLNMEGCDISIGPWETVWFVKMRLSGVTGFESEELPRVISVDKCLDGGALLQSVYTHRGLAFISWRNMKNGANIDLERLLQARSNLRYLNLSGTRLTDSQLSFLAQYGDSREPEVVWWQLR